MTPLRTFLALLLVVMLSLTTAACSAEGEINDEGINAEVEGEDGGGDG